MTTPHELKRAPTTLGRRNTDKEKERKMMKFGRQLFNTRYKQGTKITFSFNRSTRYKTRRVRKKEDEKEDTRHRKSREHGSGRTNRRPLRATNSVSILLSRILQCV